MNRSAAATAGAVDRADGGRGPLGPFLAPRGIVLLGGRGDAATEARARRVADGLRDYPAPTVWAGGGPAETAVWPGKPDLAVIFGPAAEVPRWLARCAAAGVRAAVVTATEDGRERTEFGRWLADAARATGVRLLGPGSGGTRVPRTRLNLLGPGPQLPAGSVACVSQSRAVAEAMVEWSGRTGVGLSALVSAGELADIGWGETIFALGDDPHTRSLLLHVTEIGEARAFLSAAREVAYEKPVVVLRPARPGETAVERAVTAAAFRRAGVLQVGTLEELFDMAEVLGKQPRPRGPRLAVVANAAGPAALALDRLREAGGVEAAAADVAGARGAGDRPKRAGSAPAEMAAAVRAAARAPGTDGVLAIYAPETEEDGRDLAERLRGEPMPAGVPLLACWLGGQRAAAGRAALAAGGVPLFEFPERAARAFGAMWRYRAERAAREETPVRCGGRDERTARATAAALVARARAHGRIELTAAETKRVLAAYGIATGGTAAADGAGLALLLTGRLAAGFGPVVALGAARPWGAPGRDEAVELAPLNSTLARRLAEATPAGAAMNPENGYSEADRAALATLTVCGGRLLAEQEGVAELTIEPLWVRPGGAVAAAARIRLLPPGTVRPAPAIRPYPARYTVRRNLRDGTPVELRAIRPEDEPAMVAFHGTLSDESVHFRYLSALSLAQRTDHARLARLCFIDYDREMAVVAVRSGAGVRRAEIAGVGRLCKPHGRNEAEFAVIVSDRWQRRGLGRRLLEHLVAIGRAEGLHRLTGTVAADNRAMRALAARAGFTEVSRGGEPEVTVTLELTPGRGKRQRARACSARPTR